MGDILHGIFDVARDERGRRLSGTQIQRSQPDIAEPITVVVPLLADLDAEDDAPAVEVDAEPDPADMKVADVLRWLEEHPQDRDRIIALESTGKQRSTILNAYP